MIALLFFVIFTCMFTLVFIWGIKKIVDELSLLNSYMSELLLNIEQENESK